MIKITLRTARELSGYTIKEVADYCGIVVGVLDEYEVDSEYTPISLIRKILSLYKISSDLIFFGTLEDCIKHNRSETTGVTKG
ncbi:hypothetical protein DEAC_c39900 [Desulfosporosinus acididurans]|uniref:HTH cro/C1-type domain-containing protein n=1 Tax=Desulfosporosinus acididurans TaxID=476652 RepID=A0A0J1IH59_9FIRM|nr:helix-turn-helix transcriptional regulator [Desulfosporosinus acididurans]KLU63996.1 hypothetical protein DEAC_c39900 [Desulfosporosinus acididurans]